MQYAFLVFLLISQAAFAKTTATIHFFEALAPKDSTSSERFQKEYNGAINSAKILTAKKLEGCGYTIETKPVFYNASDSLEALEQGKASANQNVWMIVGPRRSNHYVLLVKGAPKLPTVSTMASSQEVEEMNGLHLSMAPSNKQMAKIAASEAKSRFKNGSYISVVSEDCLTCIDFNGHFDDEGKKLGLKKLREYKISGETPDLTKISAEIEKTPPSFILLPNFSKVAAQAIAAFHKVAPKTQFVGGDGWGDSRFGFVQNAKDLEGTLGFTVRGFPSIETGLKEFDLGKQLASSKDPNVQMPGSAAALSLLKIIDSVSGFLCKERPKNKEDFSKRFEKNARSFFKSPWGVSIYDLNSGDISYKKSAKVK